MPTADAVLDPAYPSAMDLTRHTPKMLAQWSTGRPPQVARANDRWVGGVEFVILETDPAVHGSSPANTPTVRDALHSAAFRRLRFDR